MLCEKKKKTQTANMTKGVDNVFFVSDMNLDCRRTTSEDGRSQTCHTIQRERRVTFADIDELHNRFGIPLPMRDVGTPECKEEKRIQLTTVSYINRNCAKLKKPAETVRDDKSMTDGSVIGNVNVVGAYGGAVKRHITKDYLHEVTFGKKGSEVGEFQDATCITYVTSGHVLVTDMINATIQICTRDGDTSVLYKSEEICEPWATCLTQNGDIALTSRRRRLVLIMSIDGDIKWSFGEGFFQSPSGVCVDNAGHFIITDEVANRVTMHDCNGQFIKCIGNSNNKGQQFNSPRYVCISPKGNIYVSDSGNHCVKIFDDNGTYIRSIGKFGKRDGELKSPYGVCSDTLGRVIVADHYNSRVSMFTPDGAFVCHVVDGSVGVVHPKGLTLSPDMYLYVSSGHLKACEIKVFKLRHQSPNIVTCV
ncbi:hypothetical protein DPMN_094646 [Dreissena polymorpha]|uniref:Uncharacterized protein n=2 Tax=Dreissena polymorpha TaxID=45954 RepID=A0A9D4L7S7_DREPO|nr:hypothetical protein DPMN_094646 [Dreissena polymorpha]